MKRAWAVLFLAAAMLNSRAAGLIIVGDEEFWRGSPSKRRIIPPRPRPPEPRFEPIEMSFTKADVKIKDQFATTKVEQEFYNPNSLRLEGTFLFPVPKGAQIDKFTMNIDGKPVEAELLTAEKARRIYEDIVRRQRDPALLEYEGRDMFRVRIFPIEPHERKKITLTYSQLLKSDAGLVSFALPLNTERFSAKPMRNVSVKLEIDSKRSLKSIYSPTHKVDVKRDGSHRATVGFEESNVKSDSDFQLFYTQDDSDLGVSLLTHKVAGEDGYFLLLASPGVESKSTKVNPKDVVFVLDTSGSMAGAKLEQAKKALAFCVENLNDTDHFEVLRFSTEVEPLFSELRDATKSNRSQAQKFIEALKPIGGTAIDDALKKAVALRPDRGSRPFVIVFLTDGRPTVGDIDEHHIVENATKSKTSLTRIFSFGIGTDVNTHLLDKIADATKSFSQYVLPEEDIEVKVSSFFTKIKEPVLANPKLKFSDDIRATKTYPAPLPDLFKGEQLIVVGRYSGKGDGAIQIDGSVNGDAKKFAYDVKFAGESEENDFIPRLWATRRVGYLLDEIRLNGESKELKEEVTDLARQYGIVTPYTAYLIQEDERRRDVPLSMQSIAPADGVRARREVSMYTRLNQDNSGDAAVAGARSFQALKQADSPQSSINAGNYEALRGAMSPATPTPGAGSGVARSVVANPGPAEERKKEAASYQQQNRFVAGRNFFQNGSQWIDSQVQSQQQAKRVRVQFGSDEYFSLAKTNTNAKSWLAVARNVQFVLGDTVYEVVD
ncbi:MAG TPA: VIT and VWA domain-containing protein [Candidatus Acidoferrum sp.]|nr:VIT and VWA domain-containing protein [Candidatus Acidoferrum sp.]